MTATQVNKEVAVVINFSQGSFHSGFDVSLQILNAGVPEHYAEIPPLPPAPELPALYQAWRSRYAALGGRAITPVPNQPTHNRSAVQDCRAAAKALEQAMTQWFQDNSFRFLRNEIRGQKLVLEDDSVPIIFNFRVAEADQLRRMPWHIWDLFRTDFVNAEVALQAQIAPRSLPAKGPLRVLAIYGSETGGINTEEDRVAWNALQTRQDINITELNQPTKSVLRQALTQQSWDILFFAGHSSANSQHGTLQIGQQPDGSPRLIAIDQLKEDLRRAIRKGLKLAIFNSCDGLGIADLLTELKVPLTIVMREPVADLVARRFIQVFLQRFSTGKRFYPAVRAARRELDWLENDFHNPLPSATWLPIVLQNPSQPELQWPSNPKKKLPLLWLTAASLGAIAITLGLIESLKNRSVSVSNPIPTEISYSSVTNPSISLGEDLLTPPRAITIKTPKGDIKQCELTEKENAIEAMKKGQYESAQAYFDKFSNSCSFEADPEAGIYRNNAAILKGILPEGTSFEQLTKENIQDLESATVMLSIPVPLQGKESGIAQEMLRGVAALQGDFNETVSQQTGIRKILIQVVNDDSQRDKNLSDDATTVAKTLSQDPAVFAVIGHYTSKATRAASEIYNINEIVSVSPTSTAIRGSKVNSDDIQEEIFNLGEYTFRVPSSDQFNAAMIVKDMKKEGIKRVLIVYDSDDDYSKSFKTATVASLEEEEIESKEMCDFFKARGGLNSQNCLDKDPEAEAIVFIPSAEVKFEAGDLLEAIQATDSTLRIWAGDAAYSQDNFETWDDNFDSARVVIPWHEKSKNNDGSIFPEGGGNNWRTAMTYDATSVITTAILQLQESTTGKLNREELKDIISAPNFAADGVLGKGSIQFEAGDRRLPVPGLGLIVEVTANKDTPEEGDYNIQPLD